MRRRRGFTFIEILVVIIVMSILATIAVLKYIDLKHRALSASATADLQAVRLAAYSAWYEHSTWPAETGAGTVRADKGTRLRLYDPATKRSSPALVVR